MSNSLASVEPSDTMLAFSLASEEITISPSTVKSLLNVASPLNTHDAIHIAEANKKIRYPLLPSDCIEKGNIFVWLGPSFGLESTGADTRKTLQEG